MRRLAFACLVCTALFPISGFTGDQEAPPGLMKGPDIDPRIVSIFEAIHPTALKGSRWVRIDHGPQGIEWHVDGWLIHQDASSVKVLAANGSSYTFRKPFAGERRPKWEDGGPWDFSADGQTAWEVQSGSFPAFCRSFLEEGIPKRNQGLEPQFAAIEEFLQLEKVVIDGCRYAVWASQAGEYKLAHDLDSLAKLAHKKYVPNSSAEYAKDVYRLIAGKLAIGYRIDAVYAAHEGEKRSDVLATWETLAKIPYHDGRDNAREMVAGYRSLIAEDAAWKEPTPATVAKMTPDQKAAYWMYHLRDADIDQSSDPGQCKVVSETVFLWSRRSKNKPNPAHELKKLGIAAVPLVIAHLDDTRPTRCKGHWRSQAPEGYYLLRYCDCCQQIFEAITGHTIFKGRTTVSSPANGCKEKECKARAERWWRDYQRKNKKQTLFEGTVADDRDTSRVAERLVEKYSDATFGANSKGIHSSSGAGAAPTCW